MNMSGAGEELKRIVELALAEDLDEAGDITSRAIFGAGDSGVAGVVTRENCVISGLGAAAEVCRQAGVDVFLPLVEDGQSVPAGAQIIRLEGGLLAILAAERTLLNFLSRLSGIATLSRQYSEAVAGLPVTVAATRKTSPGMRRLEKEAVAHGGGEQHRIGLFDAALVKDNHIAAAGGIGPAVSAVAAGLGAGVEIEVEVDTIEQLREALETAADTILLDNMSPEMIRECVEIVADRKRLEASGGINLGNIRQYAETGVQRISSGELTRSAPGMDFSLEVER